MSRSASDSARLTDSATARLFPVWDGLSLGLVGILYSVVVTVVGVVVAPFGVAWRFLYAAVALLLLAPIWHWRGPIIRQVRAVLARPAST